jgi:hypothetical protein
MGGAFSIHRKLRSANKLVEKAKAKYHLVDIGVDGRITLK